MAGFSKDYDQYNYFYYDSYFSSMELRILATFEDRNMLSLIFLVCVKYFLRIQEALLEAMLNHSGYIFCPEVEIYKMALGPERFNVPNSAWITHTLRTSFVFLMTLHKNYSYLDLEHLIDKTFYGISSVDSDRSFHNVRRL